jgi:hypothetical protein
MVLAGRKRKVSHPLDHKLVPDCSKVSTLVELYLIYHRTSAESLIGSVLQIPSGLRFLDKLPDNSLLSLLIARINGFPDLQVLCGVSVIVFDRALPGYNVGA